MLEDYTFEHEALAQIHKGGLNLNHGLNLHLT